MTDISMLCMACLTNKNEDGICPNGCNDSEIVQASPLLPIKSIIAGRYLIGTAIKKNGEGITYSAYDINSDKTVSIREFFPENLVSRDTDEITVIPKGTAVNVFTQYFNGFISLWTKLMRLKGLSALITVTDVIKTNGTAYAIYDESERITLRDYLLQTKEGYITWEKTRIMFMPVLSTLATLHTSGIIHRGLNPSAFVFSKDGKLKITDFCIEAARSSTAALDGELFDGYTPIEQYNGIEQMGPWTDIYSFCCILYRALVGTTPIDAKTRALNDQMMIPAKFAEQLPPYVINALINGMEITPGDRTDNIEQLRSDLSASQRAIGASAGIFPDTNSQKSGTEKKTNGSVSDSNKTDLKQNPFIQPLSQDDNTNSKTDNSPKNIQKERYDFTDEEPRSRKPLIAVLCILCTGLLCGIIFLVSSLISSPTFGSIKVPDFSGAYITDIAANSEYTDNFDIEIVQASSLIYPQNTVISQSLKADSRAKKNSKLILTVSTGPRNFMMPDVTGMDYEEAEAFLNQQGLICKKQLINREDYSLHGKVHETLPGANSYVAEGQVVTVIVYTAYGKQEESTTTPDNSSGESSGNSAEEFLENFNATTAYYQPY